MRRQPQAATAGATRRDVEQTGRGLYRASVLGFALLFLTLLFLPVPAFAATVTDRPLLFTFDGSDSTAGAFRFPDSIEVDQTTGDVYVLDRKQGSGDRFIDKFDAAGAAQDFSALGQSSLKVAATSLTGDIAIDNSGVNPGRIYNIEESLPLTAFAPSGSTLWELQPGNDFENGCDVAVDAAGHPWVVDRSAEVVREFANSGNPPAQIGSFAFSSGGFNPCAHLAFDNSGSAYLAVDGETGTVKYVGGAFSSTLDPEPSTGVAVDQSSPTGHIFISHRDDFNEYDSTGALVGTFGTNAIFTAGGITYNPSLDRVYINSREGGKVLVFGSVVTGTVPDPTIETPTDIGISKATFHGKVNPQGVPNDYYFEWKVGTGSDWSGAQTSPPQSLTEDSSDHAVQFSTNALRGNETYQVRLVGQNSDNDLRSWSGVETFTTAQAPAAPDVTIGSPASVGTTTATVPGTVDPKGDTADWTIEISTDSSCAEGFHQEPLQTLAEGSETPVDVSYDLQELLPSQHYCVRLAATNSFGTTTSETKEFETAPIAPGEVELLAAAPRLDTSARLNARVNPQGDRLVYRFEYSKDDGTTWIPLDTVEDTSEAREKIVISEELPGLTPGTTYRYRLGLLEGSAGAAVGLGEEKTLTTRPLAGAEECGNAGVRATQHSAYLPDCRAFELVNNADKGNQNAFVRMTSVDGDAAIWEVAGGAPGSPTGTTSAFRAQRTADGWQSSPVAPPAEQQLGGGTWNYALETATPDLSKVIVGARDLRAEESALVRLDQSQTQDILRSFPEVGISTPFTGGDLTDDGTHVLFVNPELKPAQLEEVGHGEPAEVVSIMPDGTESECGLEGEGTTFNGPSNSGAGAGRDWRPGYHRISTVNASRVYFQVAPNGECGFSTPPGLYERNRETEETVLIDVGTGKSGPHINRVTPDGHVAYFETTSKLDPNDQNNDEDVYRWDDRNAQSVCLTCEAVADADLESDTPVLVSDDFSHVYFTSREILAPGATQGNHNIYVLNGGVVRFVASTLPNGIAGGLQAAQLSASGQRLIFRATPALSLTSDAITADKEIYLYDSAEESLECISCTHEGVTTHPGINPQLAAGGSTIAFETEEALVENDVNRTIDIYQWHDGRVSLLTDGLSEEADPELLEVSPDGRDVFFSAVHPGMTGFEEDGLRNVYDARAGGGFQPPSPPLHCTEDSCQGPLGAPPLGTNPSSLSYHGPGNVTNKPKPRKCAKGRVRRHHKCVKTKHKRKRHHRRTAHGKQGRQK